MRETMQFIEYLREQAAKHPSTEPIDVIKLCYQAAFGAEHLLEDREAAFRYLVEEYDQVQPDEREPLYEAISEGVCRVNLRAWKSRNLPIEWLFFMFVETDVQPSQGGREMFQEYLRDAGKLAQENVFGFRRENWEEFLKDYPEKEPVAVHHSEMYRQAEKPAYRLVCSRFIRILPVLETVCADGVFQEEHERYVVAIDGRCASGKTTLAEQLAEVTGAGVVHMDDFFLPQELRTEERLNEPGGNVHYERFREEVLPALKGGGSFSYRRFNCGRMELGEERKVCDSRILIVEGAYSCHPKFGAYMSLRVFSDVDHREQLRRIKARDGEEALENFITRWIPMEESYFAAFRTKEQADIVI